MRAFLMNCIYKFGHLGASGEFISTSQQLDLLIVWKDAGLHPLPSGTASSNFVGHWDSHLSSFGPVLRPLPFRPRLPLLYVFWGEEVTWQVFLRRALCQLLWKWSYAFGAITRQICHQMSHCLQLLGCALSLRKPVSWCSAQEVLLGATLSC